MNIKRLTCSAIALLGLTAFGQSQATTLTMANWLPPSHPLVKNLMAPYAKKIAEVTNGSVTVNILNAPLGSPAAHFDFAVNGIADITFGVQGYTPGRFKTTNLVELPFLGNNAESVSVAYWRTYEAMLKKAGEYDQVKVLGLFSHGPGLVFTKGKDLTKTDALDGVKLRVGGGIVHEVVSALGGIPVEGPSSKSYELLSQGVANGILFPYESVAFFKLIPLLDQALVVPGGLYNTSFYIVMNKNKWNSLTPEQQQAIDKVSGEALARMAGKMWDKADAEGLAAMEGKIKQVPATKEQMQVLKEKLQPVIDAKLKEVAETGVNAEAAYNYLQTEIARVSEE